MRLLLISAEFPPMATAEANHAYYLGLHLARHGLDVHVLTSAIRGAASPPGVTVHPVMPHWSWASLPRFRAFLRRHAPDTALLLFLGTMYDSQPMATFLPTIAKSILPRVRFVTQFENVGGVHNQPPTLLARVLRRGADRLGARALLAGTLDKMRAAFRPPGGLRSEPAPAAVTMSPRERLAAFLWKSVLAPVRPYAALLGGDAEYGTLLRDSDRLIFLSDQHRIWLAKHLGEVNQKYSLIPPAPIMAFCPGGESGRARGRSALGVAADEFLLVYYGHLYRSKGIETLLHAMPAVARRWPRVRLAVVGGPLKRRFGSGRDPLDSEGYARQMQALSAKLGIADRVVWTGHCPGDSEQASLCLHAADACVLPFDHGVLLNNSTFAAAAAHGLPIVTTYGTMIEPPFLHGENVYLCPARDSGALAATIEALVANPVLCRRLQAGALRLAGEWFSWEGVVERIIQALRPDPLFVEGEGQQAVPRPAGSPVYSDQPGRSGEYRSCPDRNSPEDSRNAT